MNMQGSAPIFQIERDAKGCWSADGKAMFQVAQIGDGFITSNWRNTLYGSSLKNSMLIILTFKNRKFQIKMYGWTMLCIRNFTFEIYKPTKSWSLSLFFFQNLLSILS